MGIEAAIRTLRAVAPFKQMPLAHVEWILGRGHDRLWSAGEIVLPAGGDLPGFFCVILGGLVRGETQSENMPDSQCEELGPGQCFPLGPLLARRPPLDSYVALKDTVCRVLATSDFEELIRLSSPFQDFCNQFILKQLARARERIRNYFLHAGFEQQAMNTRLADVMRSPALTCAPETPIRRVLEMLRRDRIGSMIVADQQGKLLGIFTVQDILDRVVLAQVNLDAPIADVMSERPVTLSPEATAYDAALAMVQRRVRHIPVVGKDSLLGIVSQRDLFNWQRVSLAQVSHSMQHSESREQLVDASREIGRLARNMLSQGMAVERLTDIISKLNDQLCQRLIELDLRPVAKGIEFCWIAMGSEGRYEQTLVSDQDNGLIFSVPEGKTVNEVRQLLLPAASAVNDALAECGFPLCKGNIMAGIPAWCLSLVEWKEKFANWIDRGDPESLLHGAIFFDFRPLFGQFALAEELRLWLTAHAKTNPRFLRQMAGNALKNRPPLGLIRDFVLGQDDASPDTIDIKLHGTMLFVDAARIYSLQTGATATRTAERLRLAAKPLRIPALEVEAWIDALHVLQRLRLQNETEKADYGAGFRVAVGSLNSMQRQVLKEALRQAKSLQTRLALDYQL
jgi:CBS domain-containing protein